MLEHAQTTAFVGATDLDRAHDFYGHMLGLEVIERTDFATVYDGGGTPIRVTQVDEPVAADYRCSAGLSPTSAARWPRSPQGA
jgi:catechol 2,3-dioxygenase-like lactoylglutathione lyase family enzyme